jgi:ketosteroid isomerase-like protein
VSGKPYKNEYMFTFRFDGEKIASIKEFMDSKYVTHVLEGEAKAKEEKDA